jgi:hypothetical protein
MLGSLALKTALQDAKSVHMLPIITAEWNHNLFNTPHITIAGSGTKMTVGTPSVSVTTATIPKEGFSTKTLYVGGTNAKVTYPVTGTTSKAYKIVTYVKTDAAAPIVITAYAKSGSGDTASYGSKALEINSFLWEKVEVYIGDTSAISSFNFTLRASSTDPTVVNYNLHFTEIEVYETTLFDYSFHSLYPTDSVFNYFRPGEASVGCGIDGSPTASKVITAYGGSLTMPISPIISAPKTMIFNQSNKILKTKPASDIDPYLYFVSDDTIKQISGVWATPAISNKIVIKFQNIVKTPTVSITITYSDNTNITLTGQTPDASGMLILYWHTSSWTSAKWAIGSAPTIDSVLGTISGYKEVSKITVEQTSTALTSNFSSTTFANNDFDRMHIIEISPRLELNLTDFLQSTSINKSLDNKASSVPISSIDSNDASFIFSGIPGFDALTNALTPIFSNESNNTRTTLAKMLKKNVKFNIFFDVLEIDGIAINEYVQHGVFFSDNWQENDIEDVTVQAFDITKYLQTMPVPDYVAQRKDAFQVITDILDLAGFTDYDYDSLYSICSDKHMPIDLAYYFVNSKEATVFDALRQLFLAYQIGAYVDEFGVIKFTSLVKILNTQTPTMVIDDGLIQNSGYSITTKEKPGKISVRYQQPKILQSAALENVTDASILNSPSFIYTTSNDIVWSQASTDSLGFNYLSPVGDDMLEDSTSMKLNVNDLLNIFHTYTLDFNGYGVVEGEIVSFLYKEYTITGIPSAVTETVSARNNLDLQRKIHTFSKIHGDSLGNITVSPTGNITNLQRGIFGTEVKDHKILRTALSDKGLSEGAISNTTNTMYSATANTSVSSKNRLYIDTGESGGVISAPSTPTAPVGLTISNITNSSFDASWSAPLNTGGSAILRYEYNLTNEFNGTSIGWTTNLLVLTKSFTSLLTNTPYSVSVRAVNANGNGQIATVTTSTVVVLTPTAPPNLVVSALGETSMTVIWDLPASDGGYTITAYKYRIIGTGLDSGWVTTSSGLTRTQAFTGLTSNITYTVSILAVTAAGNGALSSVSAKTLYVGAPDAPTGLAITGQTLTTLSVSWIAPTNTNGSAITGYSYSITGTGIPGGVTWYTSPNGTAPNITISGLTSGGTYTVAVKAVNTLGTGVASANLVVSLASIFVATEPLTMTTNAVTSTTWNISWTAPASDGGSAITDYQYSFVVGGSSSWVSTSNTLSAAITSLTSGVYYMVQVRAVNGVGFGAVSTIAVTTP